MRSKLRNWPQFSDAGHIPQHTPQQLSTRVLRDDIHKLDPSSQPLVSNLVVRNVLTKDSSRQLQRASKMNDISTFIIDCLIVSAEAGSLCIRFIASGRKTTKASGSSPLYSSGVPTTHVSATSTWSRIQPSNSAGATWNPRTLSIS